MVAPTGDEQVRYDVLIEAKAALESMRQLLQLAESNQEKIIKFTEVVLTSSRQWGISWQQSLAVFKQLNAELSKQKQPTLFGNVGGKDLFAQTEKYIQSLNDAGRSQQRVGESAKKMGDETVSATGRAVRGIDAVRIAIGAIVSMILFQAIQAITMFFTEASKQARQLEDTMYRLSNVEKSLSMEGIEISLKGLEDGITRIQKKLPIFSRENVSQLVGTLAISTKQLGLTENQILDLAQAVAVLNVRSEKQEDLSVTAQHVLSSLLTGNAKGITSLGIAFTDNTMRAKAMELGYLQAGESLTALTENEKGLTKLAIVLESTGQELGAVNDYLDTNTAKIQMNKAAWGDFLTFIGQQINNLIPNIVPAVEKMQKAFELRGLQKAFAENLGMMERFGLQNSTIFYKLGTGIALTTKEYEHLKEVLSRMSQEDLLQMFPDPSSIKDRFTRELVQSLVEVKDTATATNESLEFDPTIDTEALDELNKKLQEIAIEAQQAKEDLAILLQQKQEDLEIKFQIKLEDLDIEYLQKAEDAAIDYAHKIEDINAEAQQKVADAKAKARLDEEKAEMEFQLKMKQLRQQFLLDLEDALHARDARQVLRLIKQYNLEKQKLIDKKNLEDQLRKQQLEADLQAIEVERQRKIEAAAREYAQKLEQLAIAKQRELEEINRWKAREDADLKLWYQRELEEIDRNTQNKIERLLAGYIEEQKIHEQSQAAIHAILLKWFGSNMALVDQLVAYTANAFASMASMAAGAMSGLSAGLPSSMSANAPAPYWQLATGNGFAEGGTLIATKPTTAVFGEKGPEAVNFTPLGRVGRDVGKVFTSGGGSTGMDGKISLDILLSPDLEARIVENTLGQTAEVIAKVRRTK